jgi:alpha-beta hydrolase superfamily lysophospholipase
LAVIAFDLPGHGKSEGKRGHSSFKDIDQEIDHLLAEGNQRFPGKPCFLYGHSLGGELVLHYLLTCKPILKGALVTSPGIAPGTPLPGVKMVLVKWLNSLAPSMTMQNGLDLNNLSHDTRVIDAYKHDPLVHGMISARLGYDLIQQGAWILEHASEVYLPMLLVQGTADHLVSVEATRTFASRAPASQVTFKQWEGLYHETHNELEKQQVIAYNLDWILKHLLFQ